MIWTDRVERKYEEHIDLFLGGPVYVIDGAVLARCEQNIRGNLRTNPAFYVPNSWRVQLARELGSHRPKNPEGMNTITSRKLDFSFTRGKDEAYIGEG